MVNRRQARERRPRETKNISYIRVIVYNIINYDPWIIHVKQEKRQTKQNLFERIRNVRKYYRPWVRKGEKKLQYIRVSLVFYDVFPLWRFTDNTHKHTHTHIRSTAIKTIYIRVHNTDVCSHCTKRDFFWKTTNRGRFNRFEFINHLRLFYARLVSSFIIYCRRSQRAPISF